MMYNSFEETKIPLHNFPMKQTLIGLTYTFSPTTTVIVGCMQIMARIICFSSRVRGHNLRFLPFAIDIYIYIYGWPSAY